MSQHIVENSSLTLLQELREAGFALHWLHPREKRPIGERWSEAPVATLDELTRSYRPGYNVGVRLGEVSRIAIAAAELYLHVLDIDIRVPDLADEAWEALAALFPGIDATDLPCVQSGSGGESRHLHFVTEKPFRSKKLATSEGKHRNARGGWSYDWEIELFGTGKQVAMPPSIHPDTGKPYTWLREFDFDNLQFGLADWPTIDAAAIEALAVAEQTTYAYETREPLTFKPGQFERTLADIAVSDLDYDDWIRLGQAIHHQTGGSAAGFDTWLEHTKRSSKYVGDRQAREMRRVKWKSFGRYKGKPVTMATVVEWAQEARTASFRDAFDDLDDVAPMPAAAAEPIEVAESPVSDIDLLGGDDDDDKIDMKSMLGGDSDWVSLLDLNEDGAIKPTLHNLRLIVEHDPRTAGLMCLNEFTQEVVQRAAPSTKPSRRKNAAKPTLQLEGPVWNVRDKVNGDLWSDDRDFAIRSVLEAPKTQGGYGVKVTDRDLKAAITLAAQTNRFHPVREYLERTAWDGTPRVETLFHDYVGAPDDAYTRGVSRLMLIAAVTRIFEPGHKADHVVILEGMQGKRKSTFIKVLARSFFAELDGDFHDSRGLVELMQGAWIMELPELSGFGKADVRSIKAFVSRQKDKVRLAYARRAGEFPRQCIFIGSTNDREYLKDDTGGRRWWPIVCSVESINTSALENQIDQIWAEAVFLYREMRKVQPSGTLPLYLTDHEASVEALRVQESRRAETADEILAGQIGAWLDEPIQTGDIAADNDNQKRRVETCAAEIWSECLKKDASSLTQANSQLIGRAMRLVAGWEFCGKIAPHGRYGKQRVFERGGLAGRLARAA